MRMRSVAVTLGALFLAFSTLPASAHTVLVTSSPQANSVIESIPSSISITFAEDLVEIGNSNSISVLDEDGEEVSQGDISVSGPTLSKGLIPSNKVGVFTVAYRAVAADGHVIKDQFTFTVEATAVTTSETQVDPINNLPTEPENKLSIYLILSVTAIVGGLLILVFIWKKQGK